MSAIPGAFAQLNCPCCFRPGDPFCESPSDSLSPLHKLTALRGLMLRYNVDAYLVPSEDAHGSEYVCQCDMRRNWVSGFSGSAGTALITRDEAYLWTDGRYFQQAEKQLSSEWTLMRAQEIGVPEINEFIGEHPGWRVGVDPSLFSFAKAGEWKEIWDKLDNPPQLINLEVNLIDHMWPSRPIVPRNRIDIHPILLAGEDISSKLQRVREALLIKDCSALVVSALDQIAWLFNLRGSDITCNPVFFSYAIVTISSAHVFIGRVAIESSSSNNHDDSFSNILDAEAIKMLMEAKVTIHNYNSFTAQLPLILTDKVNEREGGNNKEESVTKRARVGKTRVMVEGSSNIQIAQTVSLNCELVSVPTSPIELFKAYKNPQEINGLRSACSRDAAAVVSFLAWLEDQVNSGVSLKEHALGVTLSSYRKAVGQYMGDSFETISAVGSNASIIHYKPENGGGAEFSKDLMYLLDTGGQYADGTTDVTRTMHFGSPSQEQVRCYTRVLQGHMNLARAVFPAGTCGLALDALAREPLWRDGMTYAHGTGHGMGAYLNVHEGPMGIGGNVIKGDAMLKSSRLRVYLEPIEAGMFLSNEPGYYKPGEWGIRLESDMVAIPTETKYKSGNRPFLKFETLTKVPMCRSLIDIDLLTPEEVKWLNEYHQQCFSTISPLISSDSCALAWLMANTAPL